MARRSSPDPQDGAARRLRALTGPVSTAPLPPAAKPATPSPEPRPDPDDGVSEFAELPTPPYAVAPRARARHRAPERVPAEPPDSYVEVGAAPRQPGAVAALVTRFLSEEGGHTRLTRSGVAALALVCLLAVGVTGWFMLSGRAVPEAAPVLRADSGGPSPTTPDTPPPGSDPAPSPTGEVVVHVGGKVESPGVLTLPAGSRVADAIEAAGGVSPGADPGLLNLARPLVDGEQVLLGVTPPPGAPGDGGPAPPGAASGALVDLNTATVQQLDTLPGIGPVLAQRIIDHRTASSGFTSVDQLRDVTGIGDRRFEELRDLVHVSGAP